MGTRRSQCTWTSDEPRGSEEMLASQIASHVSGLEQVRVVASASFLKTLALRLPFGTDVKPDFAAPLSARFNARVTVVTPASTATFELKRVGKVAIPETVTLPNGQVWAKSNLRDVTGLTKAMDAAHFDSLNTQRTPAYITTLSGDILYNAYAVLKLVPPANFRLPTRTQLETLLESYNTAMGTELGVKLGGYFSNHRIRAIGLMEIWWAEGCTASCDAQSAVSAVTTIEEAARGFLGFSVRLIRKT